jgi:hypothetical protein
METKKVMRIVFATAFLLCVPLVAMQFTDDVKWGPFDFLAAGVLLAGTGFTYEFVASKGSNVAYRIAVGIALGAALLLVWINLAVGIIGDEDHPANLLYLGVLVVGFIGALIARFEHRGMARALFAAAIAQALVPVLAWIIWTPSRAQEWGSPGVAGVFVLNAVFVALFVGSALLFLRAARGRGVPA